VVEEVERNIKIFDGILRHLTTIHTAELKPAKPVATAPEGETPAPSEAPAPESPPAPAGE